MLQFMILSNVLTCMSLIAKGQHPDDEGKGGMYYPLRNQPERNIATLMMETEVSTSAVYLAYRFNLQSLGLC